MSNTPVIVGAGLAGLIAAHAWPSFPVVEAAPEPRAMHKAVLRFRNESVSRLTGIEFKKVRVRKGIWSAMAFREPSIKLANMYSRKVLLGRLEGDRSIWNMDPADRYIAPDDFYEQLIEATKDRVTWGLPVDYKVPGRKISTAPLSVVLTSLRMEMQFTQGVAFLRWPINVIRAKIPACELYQTVYFPDDDCPMYRASITGDNLIMEAVASPESLASSGWIQRALVNAGRAFGIDNIDLIDPKPHEQKFGKIAPIPDDLRKSLMFHLSHNHSIYSLGRFATWRNILLDDVVDDIAVIKRLMRSDSYALRRHHS